LAHEDTLPAYLHLTANPIATELLLRLAGKRLDRDRVSALLQEGIDQTATLEGVLESCVEPGSGAKALLFKKLDAGGFSAVSQNSAEDLRDKADYLAIVWTKRHGRTEGLQRYDHIRSLVLADSARAFEATQVPDKKFGVEMLAGLRARLQERRTERTQLYDCSNEHLEGFAYGLTSECKVQWSIDRPWEEG
jgi:hypothetical protein